MKITDQVWEFAEPLVQACGCSLWDVEYVREGGEWFLRLYLDKEGGVDIDDCEAVSRAVDPVLDEKDPIPESYRFEVCSAGLERQLKRPSDFERYLGEPVLVKLYRPRDGQKEFPGRLVRYEDGAVTIEMRGREVTFDKAEVAHAQLGDLVNVEIKTQAFGRIAAQTAKQVIIQGIREAERGMIFESFSSKEHEILTGSVLRFEPNGDMTIRIGQGTDKTDALLPVGEQVKTEHFVEGDMIRVYVIEVRRSSRGPQVMVSRTHPALVKRLFELEVPEISSGAVEIRSIAREPGSRTKIAVHAAEENIDPVGACVGARGARVGAVVEELQGEKMDIVVWSEDICQFVASALSPADVISVTQLQQGAKACRVIVPDDQLSLAIGKEGQNARLAARLTGCKIDIKPASQAEALEEAAAE